MNSPQPRPAPALARVSRVRVFLATVLLAAASALVPTTGVANDDAEFFKLIDFNNTSLMTHNSGLGPVVTALNQSPPAYGTAKTSLVSATPANYYSVTPSRVPLDSTAFAQAFFQWIDLDRPGMAAVKAYVNAANYPAALAAWRDQTVAKLRMLPTAPLYQHHHKAEAIQADVAKVLLGEMAANANTNAKFTDIYGISGAPDAPMNVNWLAVAGAAGDLKYSYVNFSFASCLVARYHTGRLLGQTKDAVLPFTLTRVGTTATIVFSQPHGLSTGQYIRVRGVSASHPHYNGVFPVTVVNSTQVTYTMLGTPAASPAPGDEQFVNATREPVAIEKWLEIAADFSTRNKTAVSGLQFRENTANRTAYAPIYEHMDWSVNANNALSQGDRLSEMLSAISILCKLVPAQKSGGGLDDLLWNPHPTNPAILDVGDPAASTLLSGSASLIPAEPLARVVMSMMVDTPEALLLRYLKLGAAPNQRLNGLVALFSAATVFDEFTVAPGLRAMADAALEDYAADMFYPDGAMLERSANYNQIDAGAIRDLVALAAAKGLASPGVLALGARLEDYDLATAYMHSPLGGLPRMGSYVPGIPPRLWDSSTITAWRTDFAKTTFHQTDLPEAQAVYDSLLGGAAPAPATTSVAFPYAGLYYMRNGWQTTAHWLAFSNTPPGRGHRQLDQNGIQVSAFGRELLSVAGPPVYSDSSVHSHQTAHTAGFKAYFGEGSSFKTNTIVVDGRSQNEGGVQNQTAVSTPRPNPWFSSENFDYVEGTYSAGYGGGTYNSITIYNALSGGDNTALTGTTHKRGVVFLRGSGLWLVTDRMTSAISRSYRQIWNFPARKDPALSPDPEDANLAKLSGFLPGEVSASGSVIETTASDGPNIRLHHLGPATPSYTTYAGSTSPYLGWFAYGLSGYRVKAANVHAQFSGAGTQMLVTAIVPRAAGDPGPVSGAFSNGPLNNGSNVSDKTFGLVGGSTVRFTEGVVPQVLPVGNVNLTARTVLKVTDGSGVQRGLVVGATNSVPAAAPTGVVVIESLHHAVGTSLATTGSQSAAGWAGGWKATADLSTALGVGYTVSAGAIANEFAEAPLTPGNHLSRSSASGGYTIEMYRALMQPVNLAIDADYYLSFVVKLPTDVSTTGATRAQLRLIDSSAPGTINTFFGVAASDLVANPTKKQVFRGRLLGADFTTTQEAVLGKTYLVVARLRGNSASGGLKQAWIRAYGPGEAPLEPADWGTANVSTTATASFSTLGCFVSFYNNLAVAVDELRVGQSWGEVVTPTSFEFVASANSFRVTAPIRVPTAP